MELPGHNRTLESGEKTPLLQDAERTCNLRVYDCDEDFFADYVFAHNKCMRQGYFQGCSGCSTMVCYKCKTEKHGSNNDDIVPGHDPNCKVYGKREVSSPLEVKVVTEVNPTPHTPMKNESGNVDRNVTILSRHNRCMMHNCISYCDNDCGTVFCSWDETAEYVNAEGNIVNGHNPNCGKPEEGVLTLEELEASSVTPIVEESVDPHVTLLAELPKFMSNLRSFDLKYPTCTQTVPLVMFATETFGDKYDVIKYRDTFYPKYSRKYETYSFRPNRTSNIMYGMYSPLRFKTIKLCVVKDPADRHESDVYRVEFSKEDNVFEYNFKNPLHQGTPYLTHKVYYQVWDDGRFDHSPGEMMKVTHITGIFGLLRMDHFRELNDLENRVYKSHVAFMSKTYGTLSNRKSALEDYVASWIMEYIGYLQH